MFNTWNDDYEKETCNLQNVKYFIIVQILMVVCGQIRAFIFKPNEWLHNCSVEICKNQNYSLYRIDICAGDGSIEWNLICSALYGINKSEDPASLFNKQTSCVHSR